MALKAIIRQIVKCVLRLILPPGAFQNHRNGLIIGDTATNEALLCIDMGVNDLEVILLAEHVLHKLQRVIPASLLLQFIAIFEGDLRVGKFLNIPILVHLNQISGHSIEGIHSPSPP